MSTKFSRSPHRLRSFLGLGSDFRVTPTSHRSIRLDSLATRRNFHVSPLKATLRACLKRKSPSPTADRAQVIPRSLPLSHAPLPFFPIKVISATHSAFHDTPACCFLLLYLIFPLLEGKYAQSSLDKIPKRRPYSLRAYAHLRSFLCLQSAGESGLSS